MRPSSRLCDFKLELGCGTGFTVIAHAPYSAQVGAFDISENMLAIGREKEATSADVLAR
jgi:predicted TPR repeat methyltransferase